MKKIVAYYKVFYVLVICVAMYFLYDLLKTPAHPSVAGWVNLFWIVTALNVGLMVVFNPIDKLIITIPGLGLLLVLTLWFSVFTLFWIIPFVVIIISALLVYKEVKGKSMKPVISLIPMILTIAWMCVVFR